MEEVLDKKLVQEQEEEEEKSLIKKISTNSAPTRSRTDYTLKENRLIAKHLDCYISSNCSLVTKQVKMYIEGIEEMEQMLDERGINNLLVKIRTERKNCNKKKTK